MTKYRENIFIVNQTSLPDPLSPDASSRFNYDVCFDLIDINKAEFWKWLSNHLSRLSRSDSYSVLRKSRRFCCEIN